MTDKTLTEMIKELGDAAIERGKQRGLDSPSFKILRDAEASFVTAPASASFSEVMREAMSRAVERERMELERASLGFEPGRLYGLDSLVNVSVPMPSQSVRRTERWTDSGRWFDRQGFTNGPWSWPHIPQRVTLALAHNPDERFPSLFDSYRPNDSDNHLTLERAKTIAQPSALKVLDMAAMWNVLDSSEHGFLIRVIALRREGRINTYQGWRDDRLFSVEVDERNVIDARLLWVKDKSQPKDYVLAVNPEVRTAKEAVASTWNVPVRLFNPTQHT